MQCAHHHLLILNVDFFPFQEDTDHTKGLGGARQTKSRGQPVWMDEHVSKGPLILQGPTIPRIVSHVRLLEMSKQHGLI